MNLKLFDYLKDDSKSMTTAAANSTILVLLQ